jgi:hypothetical protein
VMDCAPGATCSGVCTGGGNDGGTRPEAGRRD